MTSSLMFPGCLADNAPIDIRSVYARALAARDPRFDGVFFVGITSTRIYCRPVCPARVSRPDHRRFFRSAAAAERAGFRPCMRCRPELAPGRAVVDAVSRLAHAAAQRIAAGALNGRSVAALAREFEVSERHLRRAFDREMGVSPAGLALTHRLLLAKQLLADTGLPVTQIAFASGFQSLRRFNDAFRRRYRIPPTAIRRPRGSVFSAHTAVSVNAGAAADGGPQLPAGMVTDEGEPLRLTLVYRPPFAWDVLLAELRAGAISGLEVVTSTRYCRTVSINGCSGLLYIDNPPSASRDRAERDHSRPAPPHVTVHVSPALVPVLMPLLARVRHLLDLDAEPAVIEHHLSQGGLGSLVARRPGLRILGAMDGFEIVLRAVLRGATARVVGALGDQIDTGVDGLDHLMPSARRMLVAGTRELLPLGVSAGRASTLLAVARKVDEGSLRLEPGTSPLLTQRVLSTIPGLGEQTVATIISRTLDWPDALSLADPKLWRAAGVSSRHAFTRLAAEWRPWRAYAAMHLRLADAAPC